MQPYIILADLVPSSRSRYQVRWRRAAYHRGLLGQALDPLLNKLIAAEYLLLTSGSDGEFSSHALPIIINYG